MDISSILSLFTNSENVNTLSQNSGAKPSQVSQLLQKAVPILMKGMEQNASSSPESAASLASALDTHATKEIHDAPAFLNQVDTNDGSKAVNHILGDKKEEVQKGLAHNVGLSTSQTGNILAVIAPMLLSFLGKQKQKNNVGASGIGGMLSSFMGNNSGGLNSMISSVLSDKDGDGKPDILEKIGGFFNKEK